MTGSSVNGVAVLVPYRGDQGGPRDAAWSYVRRRWLVDHPEWTLVVGACLSDGWIKGEAVASAAARTDAGLVVVADADVWCDGVPAAVEAVRNGAPWAVPHARVYRVTAAGTEAVLGGAALTTEAPTYRRPYIGFAGGGIVALPAATLAAVPMDRRLIGWGQDDECWALALTTLVGRPWRGTAPLWHLWHPPAPRWSGHFGTKAGRALWMRYNAATRDAGLMRELLTGA